MDLIDWLLTEDGQKALGDICRRAARRVAGLTDPNHFSKDLVQEVSMELLRKRGTQATKPPYELFKTIATRRVYDTLRKMLAKKHTPRQLPPRTVQTPEELAIAQEQKDRIMNSGIPSEHIAILIMYYVEGLSALEIADRIALPSAADARKKVRQALKSARMHLNIRREVEL